MGKYGIFFCICSFLLVVAFSEAGPPSSRCPPQMKVIVARPTCRDDYDCRKSGKICCPDQGNTKSCTLPAPYSSGGYHQQNGGIGGTPVYCEGVRCQPYEVCKPDPNNKRRLKCQRP